MITLRRPLPDTCDSEPWYELQGSVVRKEPKSVGSLVGKARNSVVKVRTAAV